MPVRTSDIVRGEITRTKRATGLPWRELARLPQFLGIPHGTLWAIANGYPVPKKWRKRFGIAEPIPVEPCPHCGELHAMNKTCQKDKRTRHRIAIPKDNPASAARTIRAQCWFTVEELIRELEAME